MSNLLKKRKYRGEHFRPAGYRYEKHPIESETDKRAIGTLGDEPYFIWKHTHAWTGEDDILFLSVDGSPLTAALSEPGDENWVTIKEFLEEIWSPEIVSNLPPQMKDPLEVHWGSQMTVAPVTIDEDARKVMTKLEAQEILAESTIQQANDYGKATVEPDKLKNFIMFAIVFLLGVFFSYWFQASGIWKGS